MEISIELLQQKATSNEPARIIVKDETGNTLHTIIAEIVSESGADDGLYSCIKLTHL